jgi:HSP20 family molecular chaperone IbpA
VERAERLQRRFFSPVETSSGVPSWEPPVDVFESHDEIWVFAALPGVDLERLQVVVDEGILVVAGERWLPEEVRDASIRRLEIPFGRFERRVRLPAGLYEIGRRDLRDGCLTISLRKRG